MCDEQPKAIEIYHLLEGAIMDITVGEKWSAIRCIAEALDIFSEEYL